jgi:hypothetical protein
MWDELTPADFRRARHLLNLRRADTLKRHAAELLELKAKQAEDIKALDAKYAEIDALETTVAGFVREIKRPGDLITAHSTRAARTTSPRPT